jgi:hypothetical protein
MAYTERDGAPAGGAVVPYADPAARAWSPPAATPTRAFGVIIPLFIAAAFAILLLFGLISACDSLRLTFDSDYRAADLARQQAEADRALAEAEAEPARLAAAAATRTVAAPVVLLILGGIVALAAVGGGAVLLADERERRQRERIKTEKERAFVRVDPDGYLPFSTVAVLDDPGLSVLALQGANRVREIGAYQPPAPRTLQITGGGYGPPYPGLPAAAPVAAPVAALSAGPPTVPEFLTLLTSGALDGDDLLVGFTADAAEDGGGAAGLREVRVPAAAAAFGGGFRPVYVPFYRPYDRTHSQIIFGQADVGKSTAAAYQAIINGYAGRKSGRKPGAFLVYDPHAGDSDSLAARLTGLEPLFLTDAGKYTDVVHPTSGKPNPVLPLATRPEDLLAQLYRMLEILDYRIRLGAGSEGLPRVTLVADELSALYTDPDLEEIAARVTNVLTRINQQGRKYGLSTICASHQLSSAAFGAGSAVLRRSFTSKLIFRLDAEEVESFLKLRRADVRIIAGLGQGQLYYFSSYGPPVKLYEPLVRPGDLVEAVRILQQQERGARQFAAAAVPLAAPEAETATDADWMPDIPAEAFPFGIDGTPPAPEDRPAAEDDPAAEDRPEAAAAVPRYAPDWSAVEELTRRMESEAADHLDGATFPPNVLEAVAYDLLRRRTPGRSIHNTLWVIWRVEGGGPYNKKKKIILDWMDQWKAGPPAIPPLDDLEVPVF